MAGTVPSSAVFQQSEEEEDQGGIWSAEIEASLAFWAVGDFHRALCQGQNEIQTPFEIVCSRSSDKGLSECRGPSAFET